MSVHEVLATAKASPHASGEQIYEGRVFPIPGGSEPSFRYQRRVRPEGQGFASTHLTYDPTGEVIVIQSAVHSPRYELTRADLVHGQTGTTAAAIVGTHEVAFSVRQSGRLRTARERITHDVVAGATLFGYIVAHWDALAGGAALPIRFAVLERAETIGFVLEQVASDAARTTIRMRPSSLLMRLAIAPTTFAFDTSTRHILEYTGRVPPFQKVGAKLRPLQARVAYRFAAPAFC